MVRVGNKYRYSGVVFQTDGDTCIKMGTLHIHIWTFFLSLLPPSLFSSASHFSGLGQGFQWSAFIFGRGPALASLLQNATQALDGEHVVGRDGRRDSTN